MAYVLSAIFLALLPFTSAYVVPDPKPAIVAQERPLITPSPTLRDPVTRTIHLKRGVLDDLKGDVNSILSDLGSNVPSYVASGVPNFFQDFPVGDDARKSLGIDESQVSALPTSVLNIPYVSFVTYKTAVAHKRTGATATGRIRAGACDSAAMSTNNQTQL